MNAIRLEADLVRHEGLRLYPYKDSVDKLTIGVGRNIEDNGITKREAMYLLQHDIDRSIQNTQHAVLSYSKLDDTRQEVLVNMVFNLGLPKFAGFQKMLAAVERQDFVAAAVEMLDSRWAKQVGGRATELARRMQHGEE